MVCGALQGKGSGGLTELYRQGLLTVNSMRLQPMMREAIRQAPKRAQVVRIKLSYGARAQLVLWDPKAVILRLVLRTGNGQVTQSPGEAARWLAERTQGDMEMAVRIAAGIERGRRQLLRYYEEATRWL